MGVGGGGKWLLFVLRKESRIGVVSAVWVEVLLGLMQSEGRDRSGMALECEQSPDIAKSCFLNIPLQERERRGGGCLACRSRSPYQQAELTSMVLTDPR